MDDKEKGDQAVEAFEKELEGIVGMMSDMKDKIKRMSDAFQKAIEPWSKAGDDRVLSAMRIAASSSVENVVRAEVHDLTGNQKLASNEKMDRLKAVRVEVEGISWLADGFKSSLKAEIAFAITDIKFATSK